MRASLRRGTFDRWFPAGAALVALVAGASIGWNRDFGVFMGELLAVPLAIVAAVALVIYTLAVREGARRRATALSLVLLATIGPSAYVFANRHRDELHFAFWAPAHQALLDRFATRDGVIADWDAWGLAGLENEEYLVAVHARRLLSADDATRWARSRGYACDIVALEHLRSSVYAITTMNCALTRAGIVGESRTSRSHETQHEIEESSFG